MRCLGFLPKSADVITILVPSFFFFFFFNDTATTEIYTLSLHDALPICSRRTAQPAGTHRHGHPRRVQGGRNSRNHYGDAARLRSARHLLERRRRGGAASVPLGSVPGAAARQIGRAHV